MGVATHEAATQSEQLHNPTWVSTHQLGNAAIEHIESCRWPGNHFIWFMWYFGDTNNGVEHQPQSLRPSLPLPHAVVLFFDISHASIHPADVSNEMHSSSSRRGGDKAPAAPSEPHVINTMCQRGATSSRFGWQRGLGFAPPPHPSPNPSCCKQVRLVKSRWGGRRGGWRSSSSAGNQ